MVPEACDSPPRYKLGLRGSNRKAVNPVECSSFVNQTPAWSVVICLLTPAVYGSAAGRSSWGSELAVVGVMSHSTRTVAGVPDMALRMIQLTMCHMNHCHQSTKPSSKSSGWCVSRYYGWEVFYQSSGWWPNGGWSFCVATTTMNIANNPLDQTNHVVIYIYSRQRADLWGNNLEVPSWGVVVLYIELCVLVVVGQRSLYVVFYM